MYQITVFNPDASVADVFLITDTLAIELTNVLKKIKREVLDLAWLREIKVRALSIVSKALKEQDIKTNNAQEIQAFAISTIDSLINPISSIQKF